MALIGSFSTVRRWCAERPEFAAALAYAAEALTPGSPVQARIRGLAGGAVHRQELAGGAYAMESAGLTRNRADGFFESHRRYVDLQVVVEGVERMEVAGAAALERTGPYDEAKDLIKYAGAPGASSLLVGAGEAAVFEAEDAHMPSLAVGEPRLVRKVVVKVPVRT